jgi:uncharacterized protein
MTIELRPLGVKCNIQCRYCYQNSQRSVGNTGRTYDIERMKAALLSEGGPFALFGGEPLLIPLADLENLFAWGLERFGETAFKPTERCSTRNISGCFAPTASGLEFR